MRRNHTTAVEKRLASTELFSGLSSNQLRRVAANTTSVSLRDGQVLLREGAYGRQIIVIESGQAAVTVCGRPVAVLGPGSHAGESAVLRHGRCSATVTSITPVSLFVISAREYWLGLADIPLVRDRLRDTLENRTHSPTPSEPVAEESLVAAG